LNHAEFAMYRCYLIRDGRIARGDDFDVRTLWKAKALGRKLFALQPQTDNFSGIEIWQGASLLYSDQCHAHDTGRPAPIVSPFETSESTMFLTWRPCVVRPLLTTASAVMGEISSAGGTTSSAEGPGTAEHRLLPSASERAA
jgi:hypothetical protein